MKLIQITPISTDASMEEFAATLSSALPGAALGVGLGDGRIAILTLGSLRSHAAGDPPYAPQGAQAY